jgi:D-aminopeptidase
MARMAGPIAKATSAAAPAWSCHEFKCGHRHGLANRDRRRRGKYTGRRAGAGRTTASVASCASPACRSGEELPAPAAPKARDDGSIIIVVATDAPLLPHQLARLARRAALGLARNGSYAGNGSGDIFIAFSTANCRGQPGARQRRPAHARQRPARSAVPGHRRRHRGGDRQRAGGGDGMSGNDGSRVEAIDHARLAGDPERHGRLR